MCHAVDISPTTGSQLRFAVRAAVLPAANSAGVLAVDLASRCHSASIIHRRTAFPKVHSGDGTLWLFSLTIAGLTDVVRAAICGLAVQQLEGRNLLADLALLGPALPHISESIGSVTRLAAERVLP